MRTLAIWFLILVSPLSFAADRAEKVRILMDAQGLTEMFQAQMDTGRIESRKQATQVFDQLMTQLKPTKEFSTRFRVAFEDYLKALEAPWTAQDIVDVWANVWGSHFTDAELDGLIAYYTSPLGKKDVSATQAALPEFNKHFSELSKPVVERATAAYGKRLQEIAKECRCKK